MPQPSADEIKKLKRNLEIVEELFINVHLLNEQEREQLLKAAVTVHDIVNHYVGDHGDRD